MELGFKHDTIVDYCIPLTATKLGESWVNDTLSFSETTVASANLQILLKLIAENRKARYNYFIEEELECGIALEGSEVKSMRSGKTSVIESYASIEENQLWLINCYIPNYKYAKNFAHDERRRRKLLVKKRELFKLMKNKGRQGMTQRPKSHIPKV